MEQKTKGRPTEAHRNCVVARSLIAQLGDALRGIEQWEDRKLKQIRGSIMAETINGPLHYGKTRNRTLIRVTPDGEENKLFNPRLEEVGAIEFILVNEVSRADWMKPYIDFEILPGERIYQLDFMPIDYEKNGVFFCMFFACVETANLYAKHKARSIGAKCLIGDDARKSLRGKRIFDASVRVSNRFYYYRDFQKFFTEIKECQSTRRGLVEHMQKCMKRRYNEHKK